MSFVIMMPCRSVCCVWHPVNKVLWKYSLNRVPFILKLPSINARCGWEVCFSAFALNSCLLSVNTIFQSISLITLLPLAKQDEVDYKKDPRVLRAAIKDSSQP